MKLTIAFFLTLLTTSLSLAEIIIDNAQDGSILRVRSIPNGSGSPRLLVKPRRHHKRDFNNNNQLEARGPCHEDNCYRALDGTISVASTFCPTFTATVVTATTADFGPFGRWCAYNPVEISSACSCHFPQPTPPPCIPPGGGPCTVDNFVDVCCPDNSEIGQGFVGCNFPGGDPTNGVCYW